MNLDIIESKMNKTIDNLEEKLSEIRAGRANPSILNKVKVEYYGTPTPISQMAGISVPEARMILISPWDATQIKAIEKAIIASDIGINPNNDGKVIRLVFPELTEQRRKELVKEIKKISEDSKVAIRNSRREAIDISKQELKDNDITEDEQKALENKIQKLTDNYVSKIDEIISKKEQEILKV